MFEFLQMMGNYESRVVGRDDFSDGFFVSTAEVNDGEKPYETAVKHPEYNDGSMVIVGKYDTKQEAEAGHAQWVKTMTADPLPDKLIDCCNSGMQSLIEALAGHGDEFPRVPVTTST